MRGIEELRRRAALLATVDRITYEEALLRVAKATGIRLCGAFVHPPHGNTPAPGPRCLEPGVGAVAAVESDTHRPEPIDLNSVNQEES